MKRYPALHLTAILLKVLSISGLVIGICASIWFLFGVSSDQDTLDKIVTLAGILGSIIVSVILYAFSGLLVCVMDIEANTRLKDRRNSPDTDE